MDDVTPSWKSASVEKCNMKEINVYEAIFDVCGLSKIVSAKCAPRGLFITKVTLLLMDCEAMKGDYNQGIKARMSFPKVTRP